MRQADGFPLEPPGASRTIPAGSERRQSMLACLIRDLGRVLLRDLEAMRET